MIMKKIKVKPLNRDGFKMYGQIIELPSTTSDTDDGTLRWWGKVAGLPADGPVGVGIMQVQRRNFLVTKMEYHVKTAEMIIPLQGSSILTVGYSAGNKSEPEEAGAFFFPPGQAVVLNKGVLHWLPFPLQETAVFAVVFRAGTPADDMHFCELERNSGYVFMLEL
ncbi:ureidoglycolate lyase [Neomoorella thermoacetica]|uniref:ureidoglycolate lyase n=1 Tax=Neomoorella thermoacetica TaxID=1525 RepID=UPI0030D12199